MFDLRVDPGSKGSEDSGMGEWEGGQGKGSRGSQGVDRGSRRGA